MSNFDRNIQSMIITVDKKSTDQDNQDNLCEKFPFEKSVCHPVLNTIQNLWYILRSLELIDIRFLLSFHKLQNNQKRDIWWFSDPILCTTPEQNFLIQFIEGNKGLKWNEKENSVQVGVHIQQWVTLLLFSFYSINWEDKRVSNA